MLFGLIEVRPRFFVGAFAAHRQGFRAVDAEQVQAVDEDAALQVERFAQVEFEGFRFGSFYEAQFFALRGDVSDERQLRRRGGDAADGVADQPFAADELQHGVVAHADDGGECFEMVGKARLALSAQRGAGIGKAHGFDDVRGGDVVSFATQEGGGAANPAHAVVVGMRPEVGVPGGGGKACAVAAVQAQTAVRPRYPGAIDFDFRQAFEQGVVVLGGGFGDQRRDVPRAADDGDAFVIFFCLALHFAHPRFAQLVARRGVGTCFAQGGDGFMDGSEKVGAVAALLNQRFPEGFTVGQPGNGGEFVERVAGAGQGGCFFLFFGCFAVVFFAVVGRFFFVKAVR